MAVKAVYASLTLAVYVTRDELASLLQHNRVVAPLIALGGVLVDGGAVLHLTDEGIAALEPFYAADQSAVALAPDRILPGAQKRRKLDARRRKHAEGN